MAPHAKKSMWEIGYSRYGLAMVLTLMASLLLMPGTAYAAKIDLTWSFGTNNMNVASQHYDSVAALNKKMDSSDVGSHIWIKLEEDFKTMSEGLRLPADKTVEIDLNGHVLGRDLTKAVKNGYVIEVGKNTKLTVKGGAGPTNNHIMWDGQSRVTGTSSGGVITGGYSTNTSGGIQALRGSRVTLNNATITGCATTKYGGGIRADGSNITIIMNGAWVKGCHAGEDGGGIYGDNSGFSLSLNKSLVQQNHANGNGGGVATDGTAKVYGKESGANSNTAGIAGGGLYCTSGKTEIKGLAIDGNTSTSQGGGIAMKGSKNVLSSLEVKNNRSTGHNGGGIWCDATDVTLDSCVVEKNTASLAGGGVYLNERAILKGVLVVRNNTATRCPDLGLSKSCVGSMSFSLTRNAEVRLGLESMPDDDTRLSSKEKGTDCTKYLVLTNGNWHVAFDKDSRTTWLRRGPAAQTTSTTIQAADAMTCTDTGRRTEGGYPLLRGYVRFPNVEDASKDTLDAFFYSDGFFVGADPTKYNPHLATTSLAMAMSGFYLNAGAAKDYTNKHASARQFMASIGCSDDAIYVNDFNVQKPWTSTIGVTISHKILKDEDGRETGEILIPVAVRGAGYEAEWSSNVTLGDGTNAATGKEAQGFGEAANQVFERIQYYLKDRGLEDKMDKVRFWVVGYSRAGATANLTSKRLIEAYGDKAKVFGYTFEAPQGAVDNEQKKPASAYYSIHNVINYTDLVPLVGPSAMGLKRYGVDHYVPGSDAGSVRETRVSPARSGTSGVSTTTTYYDNTRFETAPVGGTANQEYVSARDKMVKQLAYVDPAMSFDDYFMTGNMNFAPLEIYEEELSRKGKKLGVNEEKYIRDFIENVQKWSIKDRDEYARRLQPAFKEIMKIVFGMSPESSEGFVGAASKMMDLISYGDLLPFYLSCIKNWNNLSEESYVKRQYVANGVSYSTQVWGKKAWTNFFLDSLEKSGALDFVSESEKNQLKRYFPTLLDFGLTIVSSDYTTKSYNTTNMMMVGTFAYNTSRIMANHYPEVNLAWLRSYDSYYKDENSAYRLAAPESVATPVATNATGKLENNATLAGRQAVSLEVEGLKGEAIYYKLTKNGANAIAKPACANGYEIYRGPIDLNFGLNDTYVITAYAMSFGVKSPETTITLRGRDGNHVVNVTNGVSSTPSKYTLREQMTRTVSASVPDQRFFKAWEITDENGKDVSKLVKLGEGQTLKSERIDFTLPEGGKDGLSANYELNVKATFVPLADALTVNLAGTPDELPDRGLGRTVGITYTYNNKKYSERVPATWAYKNVEGTFVSTSLKYAKSTYRLTLDLSAAQSRRFVGDVSALKVDFAKTGYKVVEVKRGQDQTLSIVCEFETDKSDYAQPAIFYNVTIEHYDYNTKKKLVGVADQKLKVEANAQQEYVLDAPIVKDASFTEWGTDTASGIEITEPGSDAFKVTNPPASDGALTVRAYYVPVVKAVTMSLDEPRANSELVMDPRAAYEIPGAFPRPDGYSQEAYPLVSADVTWYDSDDKQVTGIAASDEAYHAKVTPRVFYPSPWTCVFAGDVALRYSGGATWVWDSEGWETQSKSAYVYFPHTNSKHHRVTVFDGEGGSELLTTDGYEGDFLTLKAEVPDGKVFWKWGNPHYNTGENPDRTYAYEVPGLAVRWSPDNAITLRIPKAGETLEGGDGRTVAETYALWIDAHFLDKRRSIDISLPTPGSGGALELVQSASASIAWPGAEGTGNTLSQDVRARWSRETKGGDVACGQTVVYANSAYTAELDLSKDLSDRLVDRPTVNMVNGKDASRKWDNVTVSRNGDGTLHVSATYTTGANEGMTVEDSPATVTVNVVAANINDKDRAPLAQETYTFVEDVTTECEFVVSPPDVLGAIFTEWDVPADGNVVHIANDEQGQDGVYDESAVTDAGHFKIPDATKLGDEHVVTVYALVRPIVNKVVVEMAKPEAGSRALPDKSEIKAHLTYANTDLFKGGLVSVPERVVWSPEVGTGQTVAFHTEYVAELTFKEADPNTQFVFDDNCDVYHAVGNKLAEDLGTYVDYGYNFEDDGFVVTLFFEHSDAAKLIHVADPDWVEGVPYTDDVSVIQSNLPTHADIVTSDPTVKYAEIDWQTPELIEDGKDAVDEEVIYQSVWQASGKVRIPENVLNPDDVDTNVATLVVVEPPVDDKEYAEMPYTTLEPGEYATEQEIGLVAGEENGTVYYMVGLDEDEFKKYEGEPIELNDLTLDENGLLSIYAFTVCEGKEPSPVVAFVYGLTTQLEVPLGEVHDFNGDNQIGVVGGKGYTLEAGEGVTIDEDGNACARNVGEYTVTAKLKDGFSWIMDEEYAQEDEEGDEDEPEFVEVDGSELENASRKDQTIAFAIEPAPISDVEVDDIGDQGYTGSAVMPNPVVSIEGNVLEKDVDYTLQYSNNTEAGTATVKVIGKNNVNGEQLAEFEIKKVTISYDRNGADVTGRMAPTETGPNVETPLARNAFTREGWVFNGWNDRADGTGEAYHEGEPVKLANDVTMYAQWTKQKYVVAAFSRGEASNVSVADITIDPATQPVEEGTQVSVTAPAKRDWAFVGWYPVKKVEQGLVSEYDEQTQLSNQRRYTFTVNGKTEVVAIYRATGSGNTRVTVNAVNGARYTIARDGVKDPAVQQGSQHNVRVGTVFSITAADSGNVLQWLNGNGKVMGTGHDTFEYTVTGEETISLVYNTRSIDVTQVRFMSDFDQVLLYRRYPANFADANLIEMAEPASKLGYTFKRWVFEGTNTEATREAILAKVRNPERSYAEVVLRPQYERQDVNFVVSLSAVDGDDNVEAISEDSYHAGDVATVRAPEIDGMVFEAWRDESGKVLGYTETYRFYVSEDRNIYAHYADESVEVNRVPVITINGFAQKVEPAGGHLIQCLMSRCVPTGYELVETGVLCGAGLGGLTEDTFVVDAEGVKRFTYKGKEAINAAILHKTIGSDDETMFFRAYMMIRKTGTDGLLAYYSDIESTSFNGIKQ